MLCRNTRSAVEGMPMYLLIVVIVTVVSIGIIFGMLNAVRPPATIDKVVVSPDMITVSDPDGDGEYTNESFDLSILVKDSNDNPVKGAVVTLSGCDVKDSGGTVPYGKTDSSGKIHFRSLRCSVAGSGNSHITVTVEKSGYSNTGRADVVVIVV